MKSTYFKCKKLSVLFLAVFLLNGCASLGRISYNKVAGLVVTNQNERYEGTFILPEAFWAKITLKPTNGEKSIDFDGKDISYIIAWSPKTPEIKYKFVYQPVLFPQIFNPKKPRKIGAEWINVFAESPNLNIYMGAAAFKINDNGSLTYYIRGGGNSNAYAKKPNDEYISMFGYFSRGETIIIKYLDILTSDPDLVEYLKTKETKMTYSTITVSELLRRYNPQTTNKNK